MTVRGRGKFTAVLVPPLLSDGMVPLAAGRLKAAAMRDPFLRRNAEVLILEPWAASPEEAAARVPALKPDLVGFTIYGGLAAAKAAALGIKRCCGARIVFGGPLAGAASPEDLFSDGAADMAVAGEGEKVFVSLLKALLTSGDLSGINGLSYVDGTGSVRVNPPAAPSSRPGGLSSPYLDGTFGWRRYTKAPLETSRGCGEPCLYCAIPKKTSFFGLARVKAELRRLLKDFPGLGTIFITDPSVRRGRRAAGLLRLLASELPGRGIGAVIQVNPQCIDADLAASLNSDAFSLGAGVQSIFPDTCRRSGRRADRTALERGADLLSAKAPRAGTELSFIIGLPGDTGDKCLANFDWGLSRNAGLFFNRLRVHPGSPLGRMRERLGIEAQPHDPYFVTGTPALPRAALRRVLGKARELSLAANIVHADKYFGFLFRHIARGAAPGTKFPRLRLGGRVNRLVRGMRCMAATAAEVRSFREEGDWSGLDVKSFEGSRPGLIAGLAAMERAGRARRLFAARYARFCAARLLWERLNVDGVCRLLRLASGGRRQGPSLLVCGSSSYDPARLSSLGFSTELLVEEKFGRAWTRTPSRRVHSDRPELPASAARALRGAGKFSRIVVSQVFSSMTSTGRTRFLRDLAARAGRGAWLFIIDSGLGYPGFGPDWELDGSWLEFRHGSVEKELRRAGWMPARPLSLAGYGVYRAVKE